jgi:hypothetical protein
MGLNYFFQIMKLSMKFSARIKFFPRCVDVTFTVLVQALVPPPVDLEWLNGSSSSHPTRVTDFGRE